MLSALITFLSSSAPSLRNPSIPCILDTHIMHISAGLANSSANINAPGAAVDFRVESALDVGPYAAFIC
jgi:hypothetical protein